MTELLSEIGVEVGLLTPDDAKAYLEKNISNRRIRPQEIREIASAIERGEWVFDGNPLRFDKQGRMLDGQHRCRAVIQVAEDNRVPDFKGVPVSIMRGLEPLAQAVMDSGAKRTIADWMRMNEVPNAGIVAAMTSFLWQIENGLLPPRFNKDLPRPTVAALWDRYTGEADQIQAASRHGAAIRSRTGITHNAGGGLWYFTQAIDSEASDEFFDILQSGEGLYDGNPILAARRQLTLENIRSRPRTGWMQYAILTKSWNAYREGREVRLLKYQPFAKSPEPMPQPV